MSSISVCHISDLHYCPVNLEESDRCMGEVVRSAKVDFSPDVVVLSGDSTEHRLEVHSSALLTLATRIKELSDIAPVIILQGTYSHEPPGTIEMFGLLSARYPIAIANRICQIALTSDQKWIYSTGALFDPDELISVNVLAVFTCVPTLNKANLAANLGAVKASAEMGSIIQSFLQSAGAINTVFRERGIPTLGISHGTVHGCVTEHGVPMSGFDHEYTKDGLFDAQCSAFLMGHIHQHQFWEYQRRKIAYPGSIGRFHYGEVGQKGFIQWTVDADGAEMNFRPTPSRMMKYFEFDGPPDIEVLKQAALDSKDCFVRITWKIDQEHAQLINREQILDIFSGAADVKIVQTILAIKRSRAEGINRSHTLADKLATWCNLTDIDPEPMKERLGLLAISNPIAISNDIIVGLSQFENELTTA